MSKITDENGKTYVEKKPFYKKGCFWIVAVVAVAIIIGAVAGGSGGDNDNGGTKVEKTTAKAKKSSAKTPKFYKVGDTVKVGDVVYTLKSVEKTDERNEMNDKQFKNVLKVVYHVKNEGSDELPIGADLDVYGPDNNKLDTYPINGTTVNSVAAGKEADVTTGFGADKLGDFELQFKPLVSVNKAAKFKVNVQ
ncbi:putative lipoprotein [Ligilactobacillus ruminis]|uniref:DUF4352 domain-containing protein n=1 Tax=Ligilactobacillus ruminis TaxID=1623 RepID=UPI00062CBB5F|nr:DUF4352 domain-containing protein [Ligilactobacillus ruminis]KLA45224.1 putative lipoprotein [Ligilactobacillus ruminis]